MVKHEGEGRPSSNTGEGWHKNFSVHKSRLVKKEPKRGYNYPYDYDPVLEYHIQEVARAIAACIK